MHPHKASQCDYFSHTPQLLWDTLTRDMPSLDKIQRGLWGLPQADDVARDLIVHMLEPGDPVSLMEPR